MAEPTAGRSTTPPRTWDQMMDMGGRSFRSLFGGSTSPAAPSAGGAGAGAAGSGRAGASNGAPGEQPRRKKSIFGAAAEAAAAGAAAAAAGATGGGGGKPDPASIESHLLSQAKERHQDVEEVIRNVNISKPYDVEHKVKVRFDEQNIRFSGIPEGWAAEAHRQFGIPLATCPRTEVPGYKDRIPLVLVKLKDRFVELGGPTTEGVFRLAPDGADVNDVKANINTGQALASLQTTRDPHVVANLIKQFYRELKPKILCSLSKEAVVELAPVQDPARIESYISQLPEPNQSTFLWLLDLLCMVAEHQDTNKMTPVNLAIVVSPNLYDAGAGTTPLEELALSQKVAGLACNALKWRFAKYQASKGAA